MYIDDDDEDDDDGDDDDDFGGGGCGGCDDSVTATTIDMAMVMMVTSMLTCISIHLERESRAGAGLVRQGARLVPIEQTNIVLLSL